MNFDINHLIKFKKKIALIDLNEKKITYEDFVLDVKNFKKNFHKNSLILIVVSNSYESIVGYFSFLDKSKNCKTIIIDESFGNSYFNKIINIYKPNYIFYPFKFRVKKEKIIKQIVYKKYILSETKISINKKINNKNYILLTSSGTTGNPKFIRLSNENILTNTMGIIKSLKIRSHHRTITTMPMGYSYGLSIINSHILSGASIVLNNKTFFEKLFWNKLFNNDVLSFGGVPQIYEILKSLKFEKFRLSKIKYLTVAGGNLDLKVKKYLINVCKKNNIKFFVMYGQTETSPRISSFNVMNNISKIKSSGKAISGIKLKIINTRGRQVFKKGELEVSGKNVCLGYANKLEDLYEGDKNRSKIKTGDIAYLDRQNYVYIVGRKKKISKLFGVRLDLEDIEKFLKSKKFDCECYPNNKKLIIKTMNINYRNKIKDLINKKYNINRNFIEIMVLKKSIKHNLKKFIKR